VGTGAAPDYAELQARMRPGQLSRTGFLGPDERLCDVIAADREAMIGLGVRFEDLATALSAALAPALASSTHAAVLDRPRVAVRIQQYQGYQVCPWSPDPAHAQPCRHDATGLALASIDWTLEDLETRAVVTGSGMAVHLLHDHHFCQGFGSPNRVDPVALACVLGLGSSARSGALTNRQPKRGRL
jgi:hypothetical protein